MTDTVINIENVSKKYRLGVIGTGTFYGDLKRWWSIRQGKPDPYQRIGEVDYRNRQGEIVWALREINVEVKRGEVLGIIGRNGAGKSTLLKILSQVTTPTKGLVRVKGRIASLLEVGTGFHPELTGRENIYLNGAIMGMDRAEVNRKLDEIIAFSGVEQYIDTPVKRYSSGMYVRLAFSVAAHLEPEILIVDEVLAVGDFEFQKTCIDKMKNISNGGRTVIFVSHNIGAIQSLCERGIVLDSGKKIIDDTVVNAVHYYLNKGLSQEGIRRWNLENAPMLDDAVKLKSIQVLDESGSPSMGFDVKQPITIEVEYWVLKEKYSLNVHLYFSNELGQTVMVSMNNLDSPYRDSIQPVGLYRERCTIPANFLNEGTIRIEYLICTRPTSLYHVTVPDAISFQVTDDKTSAGVRGNWEREWPASVVRPRLNWETELISEKIVDN